MRSEEKVKQGLLVVLSAPSGGGKTTIIRRVLQDETLPMCYSISLTTRPIRPGEQDGVDYYFVNDREFRRRIRRGQMIEYEEVHGYLYGTPREPLEAAIAERRIILFDIDVNGAMAIRKAFSKNSLLIFLRPPSLEILRRRLLSRSTEPSDVVEKRLQRFEMEMAMAYHFDYDIVNDRFEDTVARVREIVQCHFGGG